MLDEEIRCQNPDCRKPLVTIRGHRRRQYCGDACKQKAHRLRIEEAQLAEEAAARQVYLEQERARLRKCWGNLLPETFDLLQSLPSTSLLIEQIVRAIRTEQEWVRQMHHQERTTLIEDVLLIGEQLGFPLLINDDFQLEQGVEQWLIFCNVANLEHLYQARDIVYIKVRAQTARQRLTQLSPQS